MIQISKMNIQHTGKIIKNCHKLLYFYSLLVIEILSKLSKIHKKLSKIVFIKQFMTVPTISDHSRLKSDQTPTCRRQIIEMDKNCLYLVTIFYDFWHDVQCHCCHCFSLTCTISSTFNSFTPFFHFFIVSVTTNGSPSFSDMILDTKSWETSFILSTLNGSQYLHWSAVKFTLLSGNQILLTIHSSSYKSAQFQYGKIPYW